MTSKIVDFDSKVTLDEEDNGLDLSSVIAGEKDTLEEMRAVGTLVILSILIF